MRQLRSVRGGTGRSVRPLRTGGTLGVLLTHSPWNNQGQLPVHVPFFFFSFFPSLLLRFSRRTPEQRPALKVAAARCHRCHGRALTQLCLLVRFPPGEAAPIRASYAPVPLIYTRQWWWWWCCWSGGMDIALFPCVSKPPRGTLLTTHAFWLFSFLSFVVNSSPNAFTRQQQPDISTRLTLRSPLSPCFFFVLTLATSLPPPPLPASAGGAAAQTHIIKPRQAVLGWKCSRVPAGGCERRVPAGERSDPAGSSSAQPGLAEAGERQERGRQR
ncbi:unnamed protein product [Pleuronectes platessa]|uniref:Uncharacterized protein n=1 Tax=Pleuronectes platessa TaxID=8262 RepID=A0A9N7ZBD2_PLEPL|nr:unnamed protein product [Pleuronectes platessa]